MKLMKYILLSICFLPLAVEATDTKDCEIEAYRAYDSADWLVIEGSATCKDGQIFIRLYDSSGGEEKYIGNANGFIQGYTFELVAYGISPPNSLSIKYVIE